MSESTTHTGGWFESLRQTGESLMALISSRFELFAVELQEEKLRLLNLFVWLGVAMTLGAAGLLIGVGMLAMWLWNTTGYAGLIGLAVVALVVAAVILAGIRSRLKNGTPPFTATAAEFRKDRAWLHKD